MVKEQAMNEIRIFIADAAYLVREGLKAVISTYPYMNVVGEAGHTRLLRQRLDDTRPDIVIMDYNAPDAFSIDDVKYIHDHYPSIKLLIISSNLQRPQVLEVLEHGVKGFLLKECDQSEIIGAIHASHKNDKFFCGKVLDIILERARPQPIDAACAPTRLTDRENEVVSLMAEGISTQGMADKLSLSVHTIYTHRKNIMKKLGVTTAAEVILYAINTSTVNGRK